MPKIQPRAIGYLRQSKSDAEDVEAGRSLSSDAQLGKIIAYCSLHDFDLNEETTRAATDLDVIGGASLSRKTAKAGPAWKRRPGLMSLFALAQRGEFQHLVCYDMSRLGRDAGELHEIRQEFRAHGVALHFVSESLRTDADTGELLFSILAGVAQMERRNISRRLRDAMHQQVRDHGVHHGQPPAWIDTDATKDVTDRSRFTLNAFADTMRELVRLRLTGMSYSRICTELNAAGFTTATGKAWTVNRVVETMKPNARLTFRGSYMFGQRLPEGDPRRFIVLGALPPLLDTATADALDAVQATLSGGVVEPGVNNGRPKKLQQKTETLCSGLTICACCGAKMHCISGAGGSKERSRETTVTSLARPEGGGSYRQYRCRDAAASGYPHPSRRPNLPNSGERSEMHIGARRVDDAVAAALNLLATKIPPIPTTPRPKQGTSRKGTTPKRSEKEISEAIDTLFDLLVAKRIKQGDYDRRYNALVVEREALEKWNEAEIEAQEVAQGMRLLSETFSETADGAPSLATLRLILRFLIERVEVPIFVEDAPPAGKWTKEPPWFVRVVLKQPLADGTRSILSAMYREVYQGERVILFE